MIRTRTLLACLRSANGPKHRLPRAPLPHEMTDAALLRAVDALASLSRDSRTAYTTWRLHLLRTEAQWRGLIADNTD